MGLIQDLITQHAPKLIERAAGPAGIDAEQLKALLPPTGQQLEGAVTSGTLDLGALLSGGGIGDLLAKLDLGAIASAAGVDSAAAEQGVGALLPAIASLIQTEGGGASELLAKLGDTGGASDLLGAAGKLAGGLFGKD